MKVIGLEEHFITPDVLHAWQSLDPRWQDLSLKGASTGDIARRLLDFGDERLAFMNEAGMDVQVLSLTTPGVQNLLPDQAVALSRAANDRVAAAVADRPDRFQGVATLPTPDPQEAARELERAVRQLGLHGAMVFGRTRERNLDHPAFWPIFEAAAGLHAPLYLHPQSPMQGVRDAYYTGFGDNVDSLFAMAGIGWHYETGMQIVRMILSGVFDRFPELQIVTGHWGEVVLFYLDRLDMLTDVAKLQHPVSEYFRRHVMVTPSGQYSQRYLRWAIEVIGVDNIMFSTDYPFIPAPQEVGQSFLQTAGLSDADRLKISSGNWEKLCARICR